MGGELFHKLGGIVVGFFQFNVKLMADAALHNLGKGRAAVSGLPKNCGGFVQAEERRIGGGHDDHFAGHFAGSYRGAAGYVFGAHRISSHTRVSGVNTRRATWILETNSKTESRTRATRSSSCAKNRMWRIS